MSGLRLMADIGARVLCICQRLGSAVRTFGKVEFADTSSRSSSSGGSPPGNRLDNGCRWRMVVAGDFQGTGKRAGAEGQLGQSSGQRKVGARER
jgi:hypothetical protein